MYADNRHNNLVEEEDHSFIRVMVHCLLLQEEEEVLYQDNYLLMDLILHLQHSNLNKVLDHFKEMLL